MNNNRASLSNKLIEALSSSLFPEIDTQLRAGKHICSEDMERHGFIHTYFTELDNFYRRYNVELIHAPEDFYYLRTKSTSIIGSSQLTELEMMVGKVLCLLYLSPERLAQQGIFTAQEVYDELTSLVDVERLVKIINPRSTGSDLDKAKLFEKIRSSLNRLARIGIISFLGRDKRDRFLIRNACFRFGAEVRSGEDAIAAQEKLVRSGEAVTPASIKLAEQAQQAKERQLARENGQDFGLDQVTPETSSGFTGQEQDEQDPSEQAYSNKHTLAQELDQEVDTDETEEELGALTTDSSLDTDLSSNSPAFEGKYNNAADDLAAEADEDFAEADEEFTNEDFADASQDDDLDDWLYDDQDEDYDDDEDDYFAEDDDLYEDDEQDEDDELYGDNPSFAKK
ncbi:chromosome partitioning protein MukE [Psittacicella hinzii]|uniref:Chromosome partitioning protein MukE n=1 Tax=Psittacicella hinzii TaxID=2028575 RepID=A0A3A1Y9L2_9GAMM|nr:chromosome partition protein MukE [Psittacicella hinzii]RIY32824.1 chromosome partitioning protein MukE [Psittacicella hinzii]